MGFNHRTTTAVNMSRTKAPNRWLREQQEKVQRIRLALGDTPQLDELDALLIQASEAVAEYGVKLRGIRDAAYAVGISHHAWDSLLERGYLPAVPRVVAPHPGRCAGRG